MMTTDTTLPAVAALLYEPGVIAVTLASTPAGTLTIALFRGDPASGTELVKTATTTAFTRLVVDPSVLDPGHLYTVAVTYDGKTWGTPVVLVFQEPAFTTIALSEAGIVQVGYALPNPTSIATVVVALYDETAAMPVATAAVPAQGVGVRLVPPVALDPAHVYAVYATGTNGIASGPTAQSPANLVQAAPAVAAAVYAAGSTAGTYTVTVTPQPVAGAPGTVVAQLLNQGRVVAQQAAVGAAPVAIGLSAPLDPAARWQVQLLYQAATIVWGPPGIPADLAVPGLPALTGLTYAAGIAVATIAAPTVQPLTAAVFRGAPGGAPLASAAFTGTVARIAAAAALLDPSYQYTVALAFAPAGAGAVWGPPTPLVFQQPALGAIAVDAAGDVTVGWTLPGTTSIAQVTASVYDLTASAVVVTRTVAGTGVRLAPALPLDPAGSYAVFAAGVNGIAAGPAVQSASDLILTAPAVAGVSYAAGTAAGTYALTVVPAAQTPPSGAAVVGRLLSEGLVVAEQAAGAGGSVVFTLTAPLTAASRRQVQLLYRAGTVSGPPGAAAEVAVPPLPALAALQYAPGIVLATLAAASVAPVTVALFRGAPGGTPVASALANGTVARIRVDPALLDPAYQYTVALSFDPAAPVPVWGPPVALVFEQPTPTALAADGAGGVDVAWTLAGTGIAGVTAALYDVAAATTVALQTVAGTSVRLAPATGLDPAKAYAVYLTAVAGIATGPTVAGPSNLILRAPAVAGAAYGTGATAGTYALAVTPAPDDAPAGTVVGLLLQEGRVVARQAAAGGTVTFALGAPLDPDARWLVQLLYQQGIVAGPPGVPAAVAVPGLPAPVTVTYAPGIVLVTLAAAPVAPVTAALFQGAPGGMPLASAAVNGTVARIRVSPALLDPAFQYTVALSFDPAAPVPAWSDAVPLVFGQPALTAVALAADGTADVAWTLPAGAAAGITVALYDLTAGTTVARAAGVTGNAVRLVATGLLDAAADYAVFATAVSGISSGPTVQSPNLILAAPTVAGALYAPGSTAGTYTVTVTPASASTPPGTPVAQLFADDLALAQQPVAGGTAVLPLAAALDPAARWQVALFYRSGIVSGPPGVRAGIPTQQPAVAAAAYDGTAFTVVWGPAGAPGASGGAVSVRAVGGGEVGSAVVAAGFSARVVPSAIDPAKAYEVAVAPVLGSAQGLFGAPLALLVAKPTIASVAASSGYQAAVALSGVPSGAGAQLALLDASGDTVATVPAGAAGGFVNLPQPVPAGLAVGARAVAGVVTGPPATPAPVVTAAPALSAVAYGATAVTGTATAPSGLPFATPALTVGLYADGIPAGAPVQAAGDGSFSLPLPAPTSAALTLRAALAGTASGVALAGALSAPVPVLATAPHVVAASLTAAGSAWTLAAAWSLTGAEPAGAFAVSLLQGATTLGTWTVTGYALSEPVAGVATDALLTLTVVPVGAFGSGPAAAPVTFVPGVPAVSAATSDGASASAVWSAPALASGSVTPTGYRLRLLQQAGNAWATVAQAETAGATTAALPVPTCAGATAYGIAVDVATGTGWSASNAVTPLLTAAPAGLGAAFDALAAGCTLAWAAVPGASGYKVELTDGTTATVTPVSGGGTLTTTLPASSFAAPGGYALRVRAVASGAGAAVAGPWTAPVALVTAVPRGVAVAYDGATATVSWQPLAGAAGYRVSLLADGAVSGTPTDTTATSAAIALPENTAHVYAFAVQALTATGTGMPAGPAAAFAPGFWLSTSKDDAPALLPYATPAKTAADVVLYLPQLFATVPDPASLPATAPFVLAPTARAPFAYTLTIGASSIAWAFGTDPVRANLWSAYTAFLTALETAPLTATPLGIRTVQDAISRAMPQTFAESLLYAYAFSPENGYVDLRPGMVLRAEYESYQYLGGGVADAAYVDGFVASAVAEYDVGSFVGNGAWLTGFDAFLARVVAARGTTVPTPSQGVDLRAQGGGGLIDTGFAQFQQPFCRLVYPTRFLAQNATGNPYPAFNAALLAAPSATALAAATTNLRGGAAPGNGVAALYFRGRTTLTASIRVALDGAVRTVGVGTTAGDVLAAAGTRPPVLGLTLAGIALQRPLGAAIADPAVATSGYAVGNAWPVWLDWSPGVTYGLYGDALDLPLLHGDRLTTSGG